MVCAAIFLVKLVDALCHGRGISAVVSPETSTKKVRKNGDSYNVAHVVQGFDYQECKHPRSDSSNILSQAHIDFNPRFVIEIRLEAELIVGEAVSWSVGRAISVCSRHRIPWI